MFQVLPHTLGFVASDWRVLDDAHRKRNAVEYEGVADVDEATIAAMIRLGEEIARRVDALWKTHY
ncbi:MAG TPA: hypothetical protein VMS98_15790 [Thermoanaerobaculia bacterium]|nr:hypothetical protein [Thermoanaerobaculia bacterium]